MQSGTGSEKRNWGSILRVTAIALVVFGLTFIFFAGETVFGLKPAPIHMVVYAYSSLEEVLNEGILPAFKETWEAETGLDLEVDAVFGPSGTLAKRINLVGLADVAILSNARHVAWLKLEGMVQPDTQVSIIGFSPIVILARAGNPLGITGFSDLSQPGLQLLHAHPRSSGVGEWSLLAEYFGPLLETGDPAAAQEKFLDIWDNVSDLRTSARTSLTAFETGVGDALVTYEQDALYARERGVPIEVVYPGATVAAENAAVIVNKNVSSKERKVVEAFMEYLVSDEGQSIFSRYHLRPVNQLNDRASVPAQVFTVADLGGWSTAYAETVEALWQAQVEPGLEPVP